MKKELLKKMTACLLCGLLFASTATACDFFDRGNSSDTSVSDSSDNVEETGNVVLSERNVTLSIGESFVLTATVLDGSSSALTWSSNNASVVSVDANGTLTGLSAGMAVVKVVTESGDRAMCSVTVTNDQTKNFLSLSFGNESLSLYIGETFRMPVTARYGKQQPNVSLQWISANPAVATVDADGVVSGKTAGSTEISVTASYLDTTATGKFTVTVHEGEVTINPDFAVGEIIEGDTLDLKISVFDAGVATDDYTVSYLSSDTTIATIDGSSLQAVGHGDVQITVICQTGEETYRFVQSVHIYGKFAVEYYDGGVLDHTEYVRYGEKVSIEFEKKSNDSRTFKYYAVDGIKTADTSFIMPDAPVRVDARYVNDTDDNFSGWFSDGTLFYNKGSVTFTAAEQLPLGTDDSKAYGAGAVRLDSPNWGSVQFDFEKSVEITANGVLKLRIYRPAETSIIYFGNDTKDASVWAGNPSSLEERIPYRYETAADCWTELTIPLTAFGEIGEKLACMSIACSGNNFIYIDEISVK